MGAEKMNLTDADVFEQEIQHRIEESDGPLSVYIVDMGGVNRLFSRSGSAASNTFLRSIAKLLLRVCRDKDKVYRIGHCTFGILLQDVDSDVLQQLAAEKIIRLYHTAVSEMDASFRTGINIGIATYPEHAANAVDLIHNARIALEAATTSGDPYLVYSVDELSTMSLRWSIQDDLARAIDERSLELVYQPKLDVASGVPVGAEALVRWNHPQHGAVPPRVFVPVAAEIGMLEELTSFVLMTALNDASAWPTFNRHMHVAVNLDATLLKNAEIYDLIANSLSIWSNGNVGLVVELTESALVLDSKSNFESLNRLRENGIGVSIDDFGTGFSSLSYFKDIPATELKIDKSFVRNMDTCSRNRKLVETIVSLAHRFDMQVVAEGVERREEFAILERMRCDTVQGYLIAGPSPQADFLDFLESFDTASLKRASLSD